MLFIFGCAGSLLLCGLFSSCSLRAAHCSGLLVVEHRQALWSSGFSSGDAWAQQSPLLDVEHRLSSCAQAQLLHGMWELLSPEINPMSPVLTGGFFSFLPLSHKGSPAIFICLAALGLSCGMQDS